MPTETNRWWERESLRYEEGVLCLGGHDLEALAREYGTPLYVYDSSRMIRNLDRLTAALEGSVERSRLFFAMKANRNRKVLQKMAASGLCGIDACSPGEVRRAMECGFRPEQISVTGTAVSESDWEVYRRYGELTFNADSRATLRRIAARGFRSEVGLRINPGVGVGYRENRTVRYAGEEATKFGIYPDRLEEALEICRDGRLRAAGLHMHAGSGFLNSSLENYGRALRLLAELSERLQEPRYLNLGGGLGVPLDEEDRELDLEAWSGVVSQTVGNTGLEICLEPGDYIVKDAGVLICQVVETEEKGGTHFTFLDAGHNVHPEPVFYDMPLHPVLLEEREPAARSLTTLAGNINEALDLFASGIRLGAEEGDYIGLLNAGGYGHSMRSNHCMRGDVAEIVL